MSAGPGKAMAPMPEPLPEGLLGLMHPLVEKTHTPRVLAAGAPGAALFGLDFREGLLKRNYREPLLVACTASSGEKMRLALAAGAAEAVGADLPALCANDIVCRGAEPLFFMASLAAEKLSAVQAEELVKGMARGCLASAGMAMLGGQATEAADSVKPRTASLTGFAVGVVERRRMLEPAQVAAGDCAIALASSGLHACGHELAARVLLAKGAHNLSDRPAELEGPTLGEELLAATRCYAGNVLDLLGRYRVKRVVKGVAHVKAGGLPAAMAGLMPAGLSLRAKRDSWTPPAIFRLIAKAAGIDSDEMMHTFNMGVGAVLVVAPHFAQAVANHLRAAGERCWLLGRVANGEVPLAWA